MRESHKPSIERRRQKRIDKKNPAVEVADVPLKEKAKTALSDIPLVRPLHMLIKEPVVCLFALCKFPICLCSRILASSKLADSR